MQPRIVDTDISMLQDPALVEFMAALPTNTMLFDPRQATKTAKSILDLTNSLPNRSWLTNFVPTFAVKSIGEPFTTRAVLDVWRKADVATVDEARFALWAGSGLITPEDLGYSNVWVGREDVHTLVKMGVRRFVVHNPRTMRWLAEAAREMQLDPRTLQVTLRILLESPDQGPKFGVEISRAYPMAKEARRLGLSVAGVGFHVGTNNNFPFTTPERWGINLPTPTDFLFDNYARAIEAAAPTRNQLLEEGLVGPIANLEGGLRPAYAHLEYDYRDVILSQMEALEHFFTPPVEMVSEPGRIFATSAVGIFTVQDVDEWLRAGDIPYACTDLSLYVGGHDFQWWPPLAVRRADVLAGRVYTQQTHPEQFAKYKLVGHACAGSDEVGYRAGSESGYEYVLLPRGLQPEEVLVMLPFGAYTAASLGPQSGEMMIGTYRGQPYNGFNKKRWPTVVVWQPGCPITGATFPIEPVGF